MAFFSPTVFCIPDGAATPEAHVVVTNFRVDLRAHFGHVELARDNHLVQCLHVGKMHVPFKGGILETGDKRLVDVGVVRTGGNAERKTHG